MRDANCLYLFQFLAPVVQKVDGAIHFINHYPVDKCQGNQLRYPLDRDLSGGGRYPTFEQLGPDWFSVLLFVSVVIGWRNCF